MESSILEAAERLFQQRGFARTSTTEIAREAGCNQALVHYYFRTKDLLFESIFERKMRLLFGNVREIQEKDATFEERLAARIQTHFDIIAANPGIPPLIINELLTNPERIRSLRERVGSIPLEMLASWKLEVQQATAEGRIRPTDIVDLFLTIVSLNAAPFLVGPIWKQAASVPDDVYARTIASRRAENVRIVLASLRPDPSEQATPKPRPSRTRSRRTS